MYRYDGLRDVSSTQLQLKVQANIIHSTFAIIWTGDGSSPDRVRSLDCGSESDSLFLSYKRMSTVLTMLDTRLTYRLSVKNNIGGNP